MKKKIIIYCTIIALFNYLGCTTLNIVSKEEVKQKIESGTYYRYLYIVTNDNNRYHFGDWGYSIKNDTLGGKGLKINLNGKEPFEGKIALKDISYFEVEEGDASATIGIVLGISALALLLVFIIGLATISDDVKSCSQKR
jgi:hypothetical protein